MNKVTIFGMSCMLLLCGCVTANNSPYRDPTEVRGDREFSSYDLQQCAASMVDSMLSNAALDRKLKEQFSGRRPIVVIMPVNNKTYRIFDLKSMTDTIESRLVNSGKFDFIDRSNEDTLISEIEHDMDGVLIADGQAVGYKQYEAANYILTGVLVEIREDSGRIHESYYKLTMKLHNKCTGKIDWSGEKEVRKVSTKPLVGK